MVKNKRNVTPQKITHSAPPPSSSEKTGDSDCKILLLLCFFNLLFSVKIIKNIVEHLICADYKRFNLASWSNWNDEECSVTCGHGSKYQNRYCQNNESGNGCEGPKRRKNSCSREKCRKLNGLKLASFRCNFDKKIYRKKYFRKIVI